MVLHVHAVLGMAASGGGTSGLHDDPVSIDSSDSEPDTSLRTGDGNVKRNFLSLFNKKPKKEGNVMDGPPSKKPHKEQSNGFYCLDCGKCLSRGTAYNRKRHALNAHAGNKRYLPNKRIVR